MTKTELKEAYDDLIQRLTISVENSGLTKEQYDLKIKEAEDQYNRALENIKKESW